MTEPVILEQRQAFEEALDGYEISNHGQTVLDQVTMLALSGMAGTGRNTVINALVDEGDYTFLISDTTRPPKLRSGAMEQNGVQYFFRREEDMLRDLQAGEFVEAELIHNQQVSGTSIREIQRAVDEGKIAVVEVEHGGIKNIARYKPNAVIIGLLPTSWDTWLERFLGREEIHPQEFHNRLVTARDVLTEMLSRPYFIFVINDTVEQAVMDIRSIVERQEINSTKQERAREIAQELLGQVEAKLSELASSTH